MEDSPICTYKTKLPKIFHKHAANGDIASFFPPFFPQQCQRSMKFTSQQRDFLQRRPSSHGAPKMVGIFFEKFLRRVHAYPTHTPQRCLGKKSSFIFNLQETACNRDSAYGPFIGNASPASPPVRCAVRYMALRRSSLSPRYFRRKNTTLAIRGAWSGCRRGARPRPSILPQGVQGARDFHCIF